VRERTLAGAAVMMVMVVVECLGTDVGSKLNNTERLQEVGD
jgi:hypothetical protein